MNTAQIAETLGALTLVEAARLVKELEKAWGVSAHPAIQAVTPPSHETVSVVEEPVEFDLILNGAMDGQKIPTIRAVRDIRKDLSLAQAKALVDGAPSRILEGVSKDVYNEAKAKLEAVGARLS